MPYLQGLGFNVHVAAFAVGICAVTWLLFAFTPAFRISFNDVREELGDGGRGGSGTLWKRFGANLVVIEIAAAMVLLVGAALLGKSLYRLLHADIGLQPDRLALIHAAAVGNTYQKDEEAIGLERQVVAQIGSLPGVKSVAITSQLPLGDGDGATSFHRLDRPILRVNQEVVVRSVSPSYFPTLGARVLRGRNFRNDEDKSKPHVVVVNMTLARQYFRDEDPVGKRIAWDGDVKTNTPMEIVGIVNDLQEGQLDAAPRAAIYRPFDQDPENDLSIVVLASQAEDSLLPSMTQAIHRGDPGLAIFGATTMGKRIHDSPSAYLHRASAWVVGGFAAIALLLGVVGLYGVIAYSVAQRTREIGVRMALGAQRGSVYRMILKEAGWLTVIGVGLGLVCSLAAATLMRKLLFGTEAWDAGTLLTVAAALAAAAMLASFIPARRAAGVNPVEALRAE
jgi:predicted permease